MESLVVQLIPMTGRQTRVIDLYFPQIGEPGEQRCQGFCCRVKSTANADSIPMLSLDGVELLRHEGKRTTISCTGDPLDDLCKQWLRETIRRVSEVPNLAISSLGRAGLKKIMIRMEHGKMTKYQL